MQKCRLFRNKSPLQFPPFTHWTKQLSSKSYLSFLHQLKSASLRDHRPGNWGSSLKFLATCCITGKAILNPPTQRNWYLEYHFILKVLRLWKILSSSLEYRTSRCQTSNQTSYIVFSIALCKIFRNSRKISLLSDTIPIDIQLRSMDSPLLWGF